MAKKQLDSGETEETGLTAPALSTIGAFLPADFQALIGEGFASIDTVMIGSPDDSKLPFYIGRLVGPGEPILINEGEKDQSTLPTWAFNPVTRTADGAIGIAENVTHVVPTPYMVNAACARIMKECERKSTTALVGLMYVGKQKTRKGRPLNVYRVFEKYETPAPGR